MPNNGLYLNGQITEDANFDVIKNEVHGVTFNFEWIDYETSPGVFNDSIISTQLNLANTYVFLQGISMTISTANSTPAWLFSAPYSVPKVITTAGQYPYYLNSNFKTRKQLMIDHLNAYLLANFPNFYYEQSKNGKTGDWGYWGGTVTDVTINGFSVGDITPYQITDSVWQTFQRDECWTPLYAALQSSFPNSRMLINAGNDFIDFQYGLDNFPTVFFKFGMPTHTYSNSFEKYYAQYGRSLWASAATIHRTRGEGQGFPTWFTDHSIANYWAMMGSLLHHGVDIFSITSGLYATLMGTDITPIQFLNRHAGNRLASASTSAFCMLRQIIDVADTTKYSVSDYGALIDPTKLAAYTAQYNNITGAGYPTQYEQSRLTDLLLSNSYLNPARLSALQAANPTALYHTISNDEDQDAYSQEFGVNLIPDNYYNFIVQYSPDTTSIGSWRQANRRNFRTPNPEMFFNFSSGLVSGTTSMNIAVTYLDDNTDTWNLYYSTGSSTKVNAGTITKTNTGNLLTQTFTITDLVGGGLLENNSDFTITGNTTKFTLIEALNIVNNQNMPFSQNYTASQIIGLPSQIVLTDTSTGSDGAITSRRVYITDAAGNYIVPTGTTTNYIVWAYANSSIVIDFLTADMAVNIQVDWLNVSNAVLYTKTTLWAFLLYEQQYLLSLTQSQISAGLTTPAQLYASGYYPNKMQLYIAIQDATNAVEIGNNIYDAQSAINRGMMLVNTPNSFV